jgi:hypothetical protein
MWVHLDKQLYAADRVLLIQGVISILSPLFIFQSYPLNALTKETHE